MSRTTPFPVLSSSLFTLLLAGCSTAGDGPNLIPSGTFTTAEDGDDETQASGSDTDEGSASDDGQGTDGGDGDTSGDDEGADTGTGDGDGDSSTGNDATTSAGDGDTGDTDDTEETASTTPPSTTGDGDGDDTSTTTGDGDGDSACDGTTMVAVGTSAMVDDFEDGNLTILPNDGRTGSWSSWNDGTGTLSPDMSVVDVVDGPAGSTRALNFGGTGFSSWGAGTGPTLHAAGCYDFSAYTGLTFWARGSGVLRMAVATADTHEFYDCDAMSEECSNHYHAPDINLGTTWSQHTFAWGDLAQPGWGPAKPFDHSKGVSLSFSHIAESGGPDFDIWIDDVAFTTP